MSGNRSVDMITHQIRRRILTGELPAGQRLPPERVFCDQLGVSRLTLRGALARLEAEHLVVPRQGAGNTVQDWQVTGGVGLLPYLLEQDTPGVIKAMLDLRRVVAVDVAAVVCVSATDAELDELEAHAIALSSEMDSERLTLGNLAFSRRMLELAGNVAYMLLFNSVERVYRERPELALLTHTESDAMRASFLGVVTLMRTRDPDHVREQLRQAMAALDAKTTAAKTTG